MPIPVPGTPESKPASAGDLAKYPWLRDTTLAARRLNLGDHKEILILSREKWELLRGDQETPPVEEIASGKILK